MCYINFDKMETVSILFYLLCIFQWILFTCGNSTTAALPSLYPPPSNLELKPLLHDVCDVDSMAEIVANWQEPVTSKNISYYEVSKKIGRQPWQSLKNISESSDVELTDLNPDDGNIMIGLVAVYDSQSDDHVSERVIQTVDLSGLTRKPIMKLNLTVQETGVLVKWWYVLCDSATFRVKYKKSSEPEWVPIDTTGGGVEFQLDDTGTHEVCAEVLVKSRTYSEVCQIIPPIVKHTKSEPKDTANVSSTDGSSTDGSSTDGSSTDGSSTWIIVGVIGGITLLAVTFGIIAYFLACRKQPRRRRQAENRSVSRNFSSSVFAGRQSVTSSGSRGNGIQNRQETAPLKLEVEDSNGIKNNYSISRKQHKLSNDMTQETEIQEDANSG